MKSCGYWSGKDIDDKVIKPVVDTRTSLMITLNPRTA